MLRHRSVKRVAFALGLLLSSLMTVAAIADCTDPAGKETAVIYNGDYHTYQFCNGTSWLAFGGGNSCSGSGGYSPTAPTGHGYFVLTSTTYVGANIGSLTAADSDCLTELTTNTSWMGYSTANANGQLIAAKVHGWLCDADSCHDLMPLTTYYFANAGNSSAGGASFTTDSNGYGPNDSAAWSAANYFSGTYNYWTGRAAGSSTKWGSASGSYGNDNCNSWTASWVPGDVGISTSTGTGRWNTTQYGCGNSYNLICFVNP